MIKGTQTEKNLLKAFAGESQARNRYTYFGGKARKEGFESIARLFEEIANQEKEHAKRFFSFLEGGMVEIQAAFPAGRIESTLVNLKAAVSGEHEEYSMLYPEFAKVAREEGFEDVAKLFENVSVAERHHEKRFLTCVEILEEGSFFKRSEKVTWCCLNCGYVHRDLEAPNLCPSCAHPQAYFEVI